MKMFMVSTGSGEEDGEVEVERILLVCIVLVLVESGRCAGGCAAWRTSSEVFVWLVRQIRGSRLLL